jgi:hypothetical protein
VRRSSTRDGSYSGSSLDASNVRESLIDGAGQTMEFTMQKRLVMFAIVLTSIGGFAVPIGVSLRAQAPAQQAASHPERTVWYFYRVKWGLQDEFVALFARNHLPILKDELKSGRLKDVRTYVPTYHGDGRADWTFAVAITYRDVAAMTGPSDDADVVRRLYPDQAKFQKEEQRRFEILDAHWDVPLNEVDLDARR